MLLQSLTFVEKAWSHALVPSEEERLGAYLSLRRLHLLEESGLKAGSGNEFRVSFRYVNELKLNINYG